MKPLFPLLAVSTMLIGTAAQAQTRTVTGQVVGDDKAEPLPGVTVLVKGTTNGNTTDNEGRFTLQVPDKQDVTLILSYLGYRSQEVVVKPDQARVEVRLAAETASLDDVVVIGYGTVKKRDLTGAVVSVKGEEVTKLPVTTITEALQGKIPGADISRANGYAGQGASIRIRGNRSIANPGSSNNVLYIVDGVQNVNASDIDPNDVQSIEVLKDASSTAIYGSRGANGVVIITTKRGSTGKPKINFNAYTGITKVAGYGEFMSGPEWVAFRREAFRAAGTWSSPANDPVAFNAAQLDAIQNEQYINWPDQLLHTGMQQNYQVGLSGGSENTKVYFSLGYYDEKGLMKLDRFKRYTTRANIDQTVNKWLKVGVQTQLAYINNDIRRDPFNAASQIVPLGRPYDDNGKLIFFPLGGSRPNPLADEQPGAYERNTKTNRLTAAAYVELTPLDGLSFRSTFAANYATSEAGSFFGINTIDGQGNRSQASITSNQDRNLSWENVLTYRKEFGDHSLTLTGVGSNLSFVNTNSFAGGQNQVLPSQSFYNLAAASQNPFFGSGFRRNDLISFAGRVNYSWKGRYLLTVTNRADASSKLGPGHKWDYFPSAAIGWRIVDESFMQNLKFLTELKLRGSYGVSGNDGINAYGTQSSLTNTPFSWNETAASPTYTISGLVGNRELGWEKTYTTDVGVDFGVFDNRITGTVDYYDAKTKDLIFPFTQAGFTGVTTVNRNIGSTRNRGWEVSLTSQNLRGKGLTWSTTLTYARNRETIDKLPNGNVIADDYRNSLIEGAPAQVYYDYVKIGIWQLGEEDEAAKYGPGLFLPGDIKVADISGPDGVPDGKITAADRTIIGSRVPKWTGGLSNDLRYKAFDLNVLLVARVGQWISSDYYAKYTRNGSSNGARVDYWTPENPTNEYPRPHATRALSYVTTLTEREASWAKVRNVTLGYTIPKSVVGRAHIDNVRVYVSGRNLYTLSSLKDFDPEGEGVIDRPLNRAYVVGLNVGF
ncbi:TonB-dependent receptor [Hymenobacter busanensis]|uniref:TonB-dependent receptor n=1 Tax=Hymenobacter busanensis TaxID=2607656 RepID=A0A7L4ZUB6_9BACT|nr:TonB-dependent receptor [Hymenobacter busanensis]KAA9339485.1 TonB-dependent receptor [Hymenobacter busanensis]QHJ06758.1 SusC/RagA family TonB-linked outer membrane protein [Hymenobacter busanensis]